MRTATSAHAAGSSPLARHFEIFPKWYDFTEISCSFGDNASIFRSWMFVSDEKTTGTLDGWDMFSEELV